jgi:beta-lactam-binding protein with PASTA domain
MSSVTFDGTAPTWDSDFVSWDGAGGGVTPTPPTPPVFTCVNLWSADGNLNWSADGYPGISADGYEPTPLECAVTYFAEVGVNVGQLTYQCSTYGVPVGWVITGYVPYINVSYAGQYIPLTISNGPCVGSTTLTVPNVVGMFYYDAQLALLDAGFLIDQPLWALSTTVKPQYVISQSLAPGTQVTTQTQILITVSGFPVINQPGIVTPVP